MSANEGKQFEEDWKGSYGKTPYFYMRLRDSAKWVQGQGASFTPENPCDSVMHTMPFIWLLELKSTKGASISFFPNTPWIKPPEAKGERDIKTNQVKELMKAAAHEGVIAGLVLNFRERNLKTKKVEAATYFVHINDFTSFAVETGKSSISLDDCEKIGVWIPHEKKRVHYRYDINQFVDVAALTYIKRGYIKAEHLVSLRKWLTFLISGQTTSEVTV
ncbi:hypothetical protein [Paenibacillus chitinolyticus]|uniref:hypothetical protein n=1 Tax=Paenibacillus chitinolyticus TaxID=79263 RepID=UPI003D094512